MRSLAQGVPLAKIIEREFKSRPEFVMLDMPRSVQAERFRRLKTSLVHLPDGDPQVIVVTSGAPAEGKSTVSVNLALAFAAESSGRTLLVDGDMRWPALGRMLDPPPTIGLSHLLTGQVSAEHAILSLKHSSLHMLPAGTPTEDPLELVASRHMSALITLLREQYDHVIIDTPPIVPFTDADAIGAHADGLLLVARSRVTPVSLYRQVLASVTSTKVLGAVLNDVSRSSLADWSKYSAGDYGKYYDEYYRRGRRQ